VQEYVKPNAPGLRALFALEQVSEVAALTGKEHDGLECIDAADQQRANTVLS